MEIEIKIDSTCEQPKIIIMANKMSEDIHNIIAKLSEEETQVLAGFRNNKLEVLEEKALIHIYSNAGKVFVITDQGEYLVRARLYEMEERLDKRQFARISNSEIINIKKVKNFDLSFAGTICVKLIDGTATYVSRRYVAKIKIILGI